MEEGIDDILKAYVSTANNPEYKGDFEVINSKFPELIDAGYDPELLKEYVSTANDPNNNGDFEAINAKFPEFNVEVKFEKEFEERDITNSIAQYNKSFDDAEKVELNATAKRLGEEIPFPELETSFDDIKEDEKLETFGADFETREEKKEKELLKFDVTEQQDQTRSQAPIEFKTPDQAVKQQIAEFQGSVNKVRDQIAKVEELRSLDMQIEATPDGSFVADISRAIEGGRAGGRGVDEAFDVYKLGNNMTDEQLDEYIETVRDIDKIEVTNEMLQFQREVAANGGGVTGTILAYGKNPGAAVQDITRSAAQMITSFFDSEEVKGSAMLSAGIGAGTGATAGSTGFSLGPLGVATTAAGAITGTLSGFIGGLVGSMETAITLSDLLQAECEKRGLEFNRESLRELMSDQAFMDKIRGDAVARGIAIGAVESMTVVVSRGVGAALSKPAVTSVKQGLKQTGKVALATTTTEMGGGSFGELSGQLASGKTWNELDWTAITQEGILESKGVVANIDYVKAAAGKTVAAYKINGQNLTKEQVVDLVDNPNTTPQALSKMSVDIKNDVALDAYVKAKQNNAILESQIDATVSDINDRKNLVNLENQRAQAEADTKKTGIRKKPGAQAKLDDINSQIESILNKYEGVDSTSPEVQAREQAAQEVRENVAERNFAPNLEFAKKHSKLYGLEVNDNMSQNDIRAKYGNEAAMSDGFIDGDQIIINKEVAKKTGAVNVGNHELLHGILRKSMKEGKITSGVIDGLKAEFGKQWDVIQKRADNNYSADYMLKNPDEWITLASDAIANNEISFNENIFQKIGNVLAPILRKAGFKKIKFETGRDVFNFLKEYNRSIHKGSLSSAIVEATTEAAAFVEKDVGEGMTGGGKAVKQKTKQQETKTQQQRDVEFTKEQVVEPAKKQKVTKQETPQEAFDRKKAEQQAKDNAKARRLRKIAEQTRIEGSRKKPGVKLKGRFANYGDSLGGLVLNPGDGFTAQATVIAEMNIKEFGAKNQPKEFNVTIGGDGRFVLGKMDPKMDPRMAEEIKRFIDESNNDFKGRRDVSQLSLLGLTKNSKNIYAPRGFAIDLTEVAGGKPDIVGKKFSKSAQADVNKLAENQTNKSWRKGGGDAAVKGLQDNKIFDALIAAQYKVRPIPKDFVSKVYSELTPHIKRFKPDQNDNFFAYVNSQVSNKAGTVYNREYKVTQRTEDIDAKTSEGAPIRQVAAETEADVKSFEELDLSPVAQVRRQKLAEQGLSEDDRYSQLRQELKLEDDMMNTVRKAAENTLGTKLPPVDSPKFKNAMQKAFRLKLKTPIQNMIGKGDNYTAFLQDAFPIVHKFLPKETLVQMERNVAPENRIFTTSRRITKSTEVDKLISEGLLPKNTNRLSGPNLIEKLPYPGNKKVLAFFRGINMKNELGYEVGTSTLGTRKDKISSEIGVELGFDATMETLAKPEVTQRMLDIEDVQGYKQVKNHNAVVAKQIDRDPNIKFSKTIKKDIIDSDLSIEDAQNIMRTEDMVDIKKKYPALHDGLIEEYAAKYDANRRSVRQQVAEDKAKAKDIVADIKRGKSTLKFAKSPVKNTKQLIDENAKEFSVFALGELDKKQGGGRIPNKTATRRKSNGTIQEYRTRDLDAMYNDTETHGERVNRVFNNFLKVNPEFRKLIQATTTGGLKGGIYQFADNFNDNINATDVEQRNIPAFKYNKNKRLDAKAIEKTKTTEFKKNNKARLPLLKDFFLAVQEHLKNDPQDVGVFEELLLDTGKHQGTFTRINAPYGFYLIDPKTRKPNTKVEVVEEHTNPQNEIGKASTVAASVGQLEYAWKFIGKSYMQGSLSKIDDNMLRDAGLAESMPDVYWDKIVPRLLNDELNLPDGMVSVVRMAAAGIDLNNYMIVGTDITIAEFFKVDKIKDVKRANDLITKQLTGEINAEYAEAAAEVEFARNTEDTDVLTKAIKYSRSAKNPTKGISVLDFDDTLATTKSNVLYTAPDGTTGKLNAEEFALEGADLLKLGYKFDFSEFNQVVEGKTAPLFNKAVKLAGKFGTKDMFVLTARAPEAAPAIKNFLDAQGLNIPLKNITGLGNSTAQAKAMWIAGKVGEGYNDFYFADDAIQNVKAVKNMLNQFDVKSKVQQAKLKLSKSMDSDFNSILQEVTGIAAEKRFSDTKARKRGKGKGRFRVFIPPSHEDFVGLLYNFMGKGRLGDAHRSFFERALVKPLNRANSELDAAKQSIANDYKTVNKKLKDVKDRLNKKIPSGDFTFQDAVRVYLWDKHNHSVPGISETDQRILVNTVKSDPRLNAYADLINVVSKLQDYVKPTESWEAGDIRTDLADATGRVGREEYFAEFLENANTIFSPDNLNKIEAAYGKGLKEALQDMMYRIRTGRNRPSGSNALVNNFVNWINAAVGDVMFFNMRSAVLQQMSIVNYLNFADNNVFAAAKAFANQKQYWADWAYIFNSADLKQRRGGIQTDVNGADLAQAIQGSTMPGRKMIQELLRIGFTPTQISDSAAIATGGATFYRNRVNSNIKDGMSKAEAEKAAWTSFQDITQATQQSARPDMVSQQQASPIGKFILAFQNVTSQFNRLGKKAFLDIKNRRITQPNKTQLQSDISNMSRILYYFAVQNLAFYALQSALFTMLFDETDDDEQFLKKKERMINGSIDSVLRGSGYVGAVIATLKNMGIKFMEQRSDDRYNKDESAVLMEMLNVSPPIGIKTRKIVNAEKTLNYDRKVIEEMETFDIDNPQWSAYTNYVEATTNLPANRLYRKTMNIRQSLDNENSAYQRVLMFLGWSQYNLGIQNKEVQEIKDSKKGKKKTKFSQPTNTGKKPLKF